MFTGIIEGQAKVVSMKGGSAGWLLTVELPSEADGPVIGESISINGACLTVTRFRGHSVDFDLSPETARKTTLNALKTGQKVNYERALRPSDRMGGHFVTGHVDAVGQVARIKKEGEAWKIEISVDRPLLRYFAEKGSVAVDGISLTVGGLDKSSFIVYIIPHTFERTNIMEWKAGSKVNVETDILAKYVEKALSKSGGVTMKSLANAGFTEGDGD